MYINHAFYYDRNVYSDLFATLSQVKMCLEGDHLHLPKRHFISRPRMLYSLWGVHLGEEELEEVAKKKKKAEESEQKSRGSCCRLGH